MMEGWGARAHSPGLVIACVHSCMLAIVCGQSSHAQLSLFVCIPSLFVCILFHLWACVIVQYFTVPLPFLQESAGIHRNPQE